MEDSNLRPNAEAYLEQWAELAASQASGPSFNFENPRQLDFLDRVQSFTANPTTETFDAIWSEGAATEYNNPGGKVLRHSFEGEIDQLAEFISELESTDQYSARWENRLVWQFALRELYTRINDSQDVVLTSDTWTLANWLGLELSGDFHEQIDTLERIKEVYTTVAGHPTAETDHEVSVKIELDELARVVSSVDRAAIEAKLKGPHGDFYRSLYGHSEMVEVPSKEVQMTDIGRIIRAYAWGKFNNAFGEEDCPDYWGGTHWETWKNTYASYVESDIKGVFEITDLSEDDVGPLFEAVTNAEASNLSKSVANHIMGSQWGQYTWNDVVDHFMGNPLEASRVLSGFFDEEVFVVDRLAAFKEHTIHLVEEKDRSPGGIKRMATSLLMFFNQEEHIGLPSSRTKAFLEDHSTLDKYRSGFRPRQYWTVVVPLRSVRDDLRTYLDQRGYEGEISMLDVHNIIWIYGGNEEGPRDEHLPPSNW